MTPGKSGSGLMLLLSSSRTSTRDSEAWVIYIDYCWLYRLAVKVARSGAKGSRGSGRESHRRSLWAHRKFQCKCRILSDFVGIYADFVGIRRILLTIKGFTLRAVCG